MPRPLVGHRRDRRRTTCRTFPPSYLFETFFVALDSLPCSSEKALPGGMVLQARLPHTHFQRAHWPAVRVGVLRSRCLFVSSDRVRPPQLAPNDLRECRRVL